MEVEMSEGDCIFKFNYSKVYWNSRLQTEHKRLVDSFKPGEVVCDVMAGVGPFAIPAGKKGVFVWANDLNPESYEAMKEAVTRNKVSQSSLNVALSLAPFFCRFACLHDDLYHDGQHSHTLVFDETAFDKALYSDKHSQYSPSPSPSSYPPSPNPISN